MRIIAAMVLACLACVDGALPGSVAFADDKVIEFPAGAPRAFHALGAGGPRRFEADNEAQSVVDEIVQHVPMWQPVRAFVTDDPLDVPNAEARLAPDGGRVVGFNKSFMRNIREKAGNYWALVGIAAHEVGHHAGRHTAFGMSDCKLNNELELEADYYAGFALGKMQVKYDEATSTLKTLPDKGSCSHPPRESRILILGQGWKKASGVQEVAARSPSEPAAEAAPSRSVIKAAVRADEGGSATSRFKFRFNRDVYANDIAQFAGISRDECAAKCLGEKACKGFSFDIWNSWCFLKDDMPASVLDPASVIAVRSGQPFPNVVTDPAEMHRLRKKKFDDEPSETSKTVTYDACLTSCGASTSCVAFTWGKKDQLCRFFKQTVGHFYHEDFDSGFKRQLPPESKPSAGSAAGPQKRDVRYASNKLFKGDGYARHEDASRADCTALCVRDDRCRAVEYVEKRKACRLYSRVETAFDGPGTDVGVKQ